MWHAKGVGWASTNLFLNVVQPKLVHSFHKTGILGTGSITSSLAQEPYPLLCTSALLLLVRYREFFIITNPIKISEGWGKIQPYKQGFSVYKKSNLPKLNPNITFIFVKKHKNKYTLKCIFFYTYKSSLKAVNILFCDFLNLTQKRY